MRVILDTNVILSGLMAPAGTPGRILEAWDHGHFDLVTCQEQLEELARVMAYPKIQRRFSTGGVDAAAVLKQLMLRAVNIRLDGKPSRISRDPNDDYLVALLIASESEVLVSGDGDLLALAGEYPVVAPEVFAFRL